MGTIREQILLASQLSAGTIRELLAVPNTGTGGGGGGADATSYTEQKMVELLLLNEDFILVGDQNGLRGSEIIGNVYMALFYADPGEPGFQSQEADFPGYTRVPVVRGPAGWEYVNGSGRNRVPITWQPNAGPEVTITHIGMMDSLIGGNVLFRSALETPVAIPTNDQFEFAYGELTLKMD
jgi:hypothetical protein